jgi:hypothetical protein
VDPRGGGDVDVRVLVDGLVDDFVDSRTEEVYEVEVFGFGRVRGKC